VKLSGARLTAIIVLVVLAALTGLAHFGAAAQTIDTAAMGCLPRSACVRSTMWLVFAGVFLVAALIVYLSRPKVHTKENEEVHA
jgi:hypothetical protein